MKRKLIDYDVFKQIESKFLQTAEKELNEATDAIATALGKDNIALFGITESEATFATDQGTLVHATYIIDDSKLLLENIEELIVDEDSQINEGKSILDKMVDSILDDNKNSASDLFLAISAFLMFVLAYKKALSTKLRSMAKAKCLLSFSLISKRNQLKRVPKSTTASVKSL